jgi:hypothetical protein
MKGFATDMAAKLLRRPGPVKGCVVAPDDEDALWITAALHDDERGRSAWLRLADGLDLDAIDGAQVRLLPLVRRNLEAWGCNHPDMARMAGVERASWVRTQRLIDSAAEALAALTERGIDTLVMKGVALASTAYPRATFRPMRDIDLLVRPVDVPTATRVLATLGYSGASPFDRQATIGRHALTYGRGDGAAVDLHWMPHRMLAPRGIAGTFRDLPWDAGIAADSCWERAGEVVIGGASARVPSPADLLVHACVHGLASPGGGRLQWFADCAAILRSEAPIDWDVAVAEARDRHLVPLLRRALGLLATTGDLPIPTVVLDELAHAPSTARDRLVARPPCEPSPVGTLAGSLPVAIFHYLALTAREPAPAAIRGAPWCLAAWWGVDRPTGLIAFGASRARRNLRRWRAR